MSKRAAIQRKGAWMMTFTGRAFYPYDLREEDFDIRDIAHALSMLCRYGGHCSSFYSVAEHCVHASHLVSPEHALPALMHDATEAYLVDMPRPIKAGFPQYRQMESQLWEFVARKWDLPLVLPDEVELADGWMLYHEQAALMKASPPGLEWGMGRPRPEKLRPELIMCWGPTKAEQVFLKRFEELQ